MLLKYVLSFSLNADRAPAAEGQRWLSSLSEQKVSGERIELFNYVGRQMQNRERSDRVALNRLKPYHLTWRQFYVRMFVASVYCGSATCLEVNISTRPGRCAPGSAFVDPLRNAQQVLAADRNQQASHRQLASSAVVARPLKRGVMPLLNG